MLKTIKAWINKRVTVVLLVVLTLQTAMHSPLGCLLMLHFYMLGICSRNNGPIYLLMMRGKVLSISFCQHHLQQPSQLPTLWTLPNSVRLSSAAYSPWGSCGPLIPHSAVHLYSYCVYLHPNIQYIAFELFPCLSLDLTHRRCIINGIKLKQNSSFWAFVGSHLNNLHQTNRRSNHLAIKGHVL